MEYNLYCDESNHLLHSENPYMVLGYTQCEKDITREVHVYIRNLKEKHGLKRDYELKWTKVSKSLIPFYSDLIQFFFENKSLSFRAVVADKGVLDHSSFQQTHDEWYYKMYYLLLGKTLNEVSTYNIYLDIKDTIGSKKVEKLRKVLSNSYYDFSNEMISKLQLVKSDEVELLQLADLFIGAIGYRNCNLKTSKAKLKVIEIIESNHKKLLTDSTSRIEPKFNIFIWKPRV